jgi:hypothetical protein
MTGRRQTLDEDLVERAARALAEANNDGCFDGEHEDPEMWESNAEDRDYSRRLARAALSVLTHADDASTPEDADDNGLPECRVCDGTGCARCGGSGNEPHVTDDARTPASEFSIWVCIEQGHGYHDTERPCPLSIPEGA